MKRIKIRYSVLPALLFGFISTISASDWNAAFEQPQYAEITLISANADDISALENLKFDCEKITTAQLLEYIPKLLPAVETPDYKLSIFLRKSENRRYLEQVKNKMKNFMETCGYKYGKDETWTKALSLAEAASARLETILNW